MNYTNEDYRALAAAVAERVPAVADAGILIDTDNLCGAHFRHSSGTYTVTLSHGEAAPGAFFADAAALCGPQFSPEALLRACDDMKRPFTRYLRRDKATDEPLPGLPVGCMQLDSLYTASYAPGLQKLVQTLRTDANKDAPVILVGQTAAFYPAEYAVRQLLSFSPLSPVIEGLVTDPTLTVPATALIEKGKLLLAEQERAKKRLPHTLMLQFKKLENGDLVNHLHILAEKGCDIDTLERSAFSETVKVCSEDPIILFADSTPYSLRLPEQVFPRGIEGRPRPDLYRPHLLSAAAQFALGLSEGIPVLRVRSEYGAAQIALDKNIYSEG